MKILIYGSAYPHALEIFYKKHISSYGHEVVIFDGADQFQKYYNKSLLHKLFFRIGVSLIHKKINKGFHDFIEQFKPNVILVFKGMELFPSTIEKIKTTGIIIANYNPDHPFKYHGRGSGNKNVLKSISFYSFHLTYSLEIKKELEKRFEVCCEWLPFGYEPSTQTFPQQEDEIKKVCFIGFADKERVETILFLANSGVPIDVYGPNWSKYLKNNQNIKIYGPVFNEQFNETAINYRIQLNLFRPHNKNSHNMRTFEMTGIGCIMLAPDSKEHRLFFEPDKEVFLFNSPKEMLEKIKYLLNLNYNDAKEIRKNVTKKCSNAGYDYKARAQELLKSFDNNKS